MSSVQQTLAMQPARCEGSTAGAVLGHQRPVRRGVSRPLMPSELVIVATLALAIVVGAVWPRIQEPADIRTTTLRIEPGQTLWTIAETHPVEGLTTQQSADLIASINGLRGTVNAGSVIRVPSQAAGSALAMR